MLKIILTFWFFLLGSAVGSFLNVVIYRLPRRESIIFPPSHCPSCGHKLSAKDLIPILSYILLKGRCRYCGARISWRYPAVEFITGISYAILFWIYGFSLFIFKSLILISMLIPIFFIDLENMLIPDVISIPGIVVGLLFSFWEGNLVQGVLGSLIFGGILLLIYVVALLILKEEGMGQGDIKLGFMLGSFLGLKLSLFAIFLSYLIGGIFSIFVIVLRSKNLKTAIPFGPFLITGALISLFWGEVLIKLYLSLVFR
ncbi:prepilin peptidase [Dictyoglomus thermophilum]|uniref:Prepilin leader peptidase/N-methyltransferase n=1 Tax=Dictyoglomus thermophilum TaxID=14 RepID=A0A7C2GH48_DICTH|nr:A24 family peptidase [Dictyoglomus thermophilum]TYT20970.1 prepilin peptidase [Dictyoglomus thermophilum]